MSLTLPSTAQGPRSFRAPWPAWWAILGFFALLAVPSVRADARGTAACAAVGGGLALWSLGVWYARGRQDRTFEASFTAVPAHWVQASVQGVLLVYWGLYVSAVPHHAPLIGAQVAFVYAFDALLAWSRGRPWRTGFGPLPIVFSTNLLLWFRPEWFALQFVMLAIGVLGKNFVTWERDGRRTHVFNPSAFGQSVVALALIATDTTRELTVGKEIAASFDTPHMLVVIFLCGLVVQSLFHVTLMTLGAATTLCLIGLAYEALFGTYLFVNVNVAAPIFLGIHLLLTDPATSPRTNVGRVAFGAAYAVGYAVLFRAFDSLEIPTFWDKLLPVPVLNLCVPWIDRVSRAGLLGRLENAWQRAATPARANLAHMLCWIGVFTTWLATGFVEAPHPGESVTFWKRAVAEHKPHAQHALVMAVGAQAEGRQVPAAYNELGLICLGGGVVKENRALAANYFARASAMGDPSGALNVVAQFLLHGERRSDLDLEYAFTRVEALCEEGHDGPACWLLGRAYEIGRGRPQDDRRALAAYMRCPVGNPYAAKGLARLALRRPLAAKLMAVVVADLETSRAHGDAEASWYLAYLTAAGIGVRHDPFRVRALLEECCGRGIERACEALRAPAIPPYTMPDVVSAPPFSTGYPMP